MWGWSLRGLRCVRLTWSKLVPQRDSGELAKRDERLLSSTREDKFQATCVMLWLQPYLRQCKVQSSKAWTVCAQHSVWPYTNHHERHRLPASLTIRPPHVAHRHTRPHARHLPTRTAGGRHRCARGLPRQQFAHSRCTLGIAPPDGQVRGRRVVLGGDEPDPRAQHATPPA